jgi:hypothetical protein
MVIRSLTVTRSLWKIGTDGAYGGWAGWWLDFFVVVRRFIGFSIVDSLIADWKFCSDERVKARAKPSIHGQYFDMRTNISRWWRHRCTRSDSHINNMAALLPSRPWTISKTLISKTDFLIYYRRPKIDSSAIKWASSAIDVDPPIYQHHQHRQYNGINIINIINIDAWRYHYPKHRQNSLDPY